MYYVITVGSETHYMVMLDTKKGPGPHLNIKTIFPGLGISFIKIRRSYLYNGNSYTVLYIDTTTHPPTPSLTDLIDGLVVQDCDISNAVAMEILQFCLKPSKWNEHHMHKATFSEHLSTHNSYPMWTTRCFFIPGHSVITNVCTYHDSTAAMSCAKFWNNYLLACSRMREQGVQFTSRLWPCNSLSWLKAMGTATAQHIWCVHTTSGWCMYVNFSELLRE